MKFDGHEIDSARFIKKIRMTSHHFPCGARPATANDLGDARADEVDARAHVGALAFVKHALAALERL